MALVGESRDGAGMRKRSERDELIRRVTQRRAPVAAVAAEFGLPASTAYRWMRVAGLAEAAPMTRPTFVEVVAERAERSTILVRVAWRRPRCARGSTRGCCAS